MLALVPHGERERQAKQRVLYIWVRKIAPNHAPSEARTTRGGSVSLRMRGSLWTVYSHPWKIPVAEVWGHSKYRVARMMQASAPPRVQFQIARLNLASVQPDRAVDTVSWPLVALLLRAAASHRAALSYRIVWADQPVVWIVPVVQAASAMVAQQLLKSNGKRVRAIQSPGMRIQMGHQLQKATCAAAHLAGAVELERRKTLAC
jgi:hypothetical protein